MAGTGEGPREPPCEPPREPEGLEVASRPVLGRQEERPLGRARCSGSSSPGALPPAAGPHPVPGNCPGMMPPSGLAPAWEVAPLSATPAGLAGSGICDSKGSVTCSACGSSVARQGLETRPEASQAPESSSEGTDFRGPVRRASGRWPGSPVLTSRLVRCGGERVSTRLHWAAPSLQRTPGGGLVSSGLWTHSALSWVTGR